MWCPPIAPRDVESLRLFYRQICQSDGLRDQDENWCANDLQSAERSMPRKHHFPACDESKSEHNHNRCFGIV